jgi:uncharacterized membrane protein
MLTTVVLFCFLIGCIVGLRSLTAPAAVCWGAHLGWLHFTGTSLSFIDHLPTLGLFTLLAVAELVADKLPKTPARTAALGLTARIIMGAFCGAALAVAASGSGIIGGSLIGIIGALVGTFGGYEIRHTLVTMAKLPDFAVALAEDLVAILGAFYIVSRV